MCRNSCNTYLDSSVHSPVLDGIVELVDLEDTFGLQLKLARTKMQLNSDVDSFLSRNLLAILWHHAEHNLVDIFRAIEIREH